MNGLSELPPNTPAPAPIERHYSVKTASEITEQSASWWWREIKAGRVRAVRLRSIGDPQRWSVRIPESEIRKLMIAVPR